MSAARVQMGNYQWVFNKLDLGPVTLDVDSSVLTHWGSQIEGGAKGYNPKNRGRASHHPLLALCADWRLVANFWLRAGNTNSSNNVLAFLEATLANVGATTVGLFRANSGFYDKTIVAFLKGRKINHIISARLTQALQQAIVDRCQWQDVAPGLQVSELCYQPHGWQEPQRLVVIHQHTQRKAAGVPRKTLSLFARHTGVELVSKTRRLREPH
jgi:hypothetical protein